MGNANMVVKKLTHMMNVSLPTSYSMTDIRGFLVIKIGWRKKILIDGFRLWLEQNIGMCFATTSSKGQGR